MNNRLIINEIYPLEELQFMATPNEWHHSKEYRSQSRRREWLSWRVALRRSLTEDPFMGIGGDIEIAYYKSGAPFIVDAPIYIGVTHTSTHVAILICEHNCAVDMERLDRNFLTIAPRYLSAPELEITNSTIGLAIGWCSKECAYKYIADKSLDLIKDIVINNIDYTNTSVALSICEVAYTAQFKIEESYCVVWMD